MKKRGRPKVKKREFKQPFAMRFSAAELESFQAAAGKQSLRDWMRETLVAATPAHHDTDAHLAAQAEEAARLARDHLRRASDTGAPFQARRAHSSLPAVATDRASD